jgi:hypothetical protein
MNGEFRALLFPFLVIALALAFPARGGVVRGKVYDAAEPNKVLPGIDVQISSVNQESEKGITNAKGDYLVKVSAAIGTTIHASYGGGGYGTLKMDIAMEQEEVEKNVGLVRPNSDDQKYWVKIIENWPSGGDRAELWRKADQLDISAVAKVSLSKALEQTTPQAAWKYPEIKAYSGTDLSDVKSLVALVEAALEEKDLVPAKKGIIGESPSLNSLPVQVVADVFAESLRSKNKAEQATNLEFIRASWGPEIQTQTHERISKFAVFDRSSNPFEHD